MNILALDLGTATGWAPIFGWTEYEISRSGQVRRISAGQGAVTGRILSAWFNQHGYPCVTLYRRNKGHTFPIHRLLAITFLDSPKAGQTQVAHNDGDPTNISLSNLRWASPLENKLDKHIHGTDNFGERNPMAKLTVDQVREIREAAKNGQSHKCISSKYEICRQTVGDIVNGRRWGHV